MATTVFLLDGYGWTGILRYATIPISLGSTFVQVPYNNNIAGSPSNIASAAATLNTYLTNTAYTPPINVCAISMGAQVCYKWLRDYGPTSTVSPANVQFTLLGNPENKYTGSAVLIQKQMMPQGTYGGIGVPTDTPYTVTNVIRQYDGVADYPNLPNPNATATANAYVGMCTIHDAYMFLKLTDSHESVTEGNVTTSWYGPTYPCPYVAPFSIVDYFLGISYDSATADENQARDMQYRPIIESAYRRPVAIPSPAYGGLGVFPIVLG